MKKPLLLYLLIQATFFSCKRDKVSIQQNHISFNKSFVFEVQDTIHVNYLTKNLKVFDSSPSLKKYLMMSSTEMDTILLVNENGAIESKYSLLGQDDKSVGLSIFGLGFASDSTFVVSSSRGFYVYHLKSADQIQFYPEKTYPQGYGGAYSYNVENFEHEGNQYYASFRKGSLDDVNILKLNKEDLNRYKPITFFNTSNSEVSLSFGIGQNSLYLKGQEHFGELYTLFDYSSKFKKFALINNPSNTLLMYESLKNNPTEVPLILEHFQLPIKYKYGRNYEQNFENQIVNSMYRDINWGDRYLLITYRTGIPMEVYEEMQSFAQLPELFKKHMQYYSVLIDSSLKVSSDIMLPKDAVGVASYFSNEEVLLYTNPAITETDSTVVFYKAKLKSSND
ncbi:MAG: hypothetical protein HWD84_10630 [Flavobacteriaceae bacterium]|nr:hypothetical protein [Flavobacteriaceae bacterium]